MTVYEMLGIAAIALVGSAATIAIYLGLLNWFGGFYIVHCRRCHHLTGSSTAEPQSSCPHCRHPLLLHPLYAAFHRGAPVRVLPDSLHY
jgi:DNA-directed RNA polymerase subunit RPC12/RpoP